MKRLADNRRARHDYDILEEYEAGLVLQGWEVKSTRAGRAQLTDGHVIVKHGELFLLNSYISPLPTTSTHFSPAPNRTRKLLLNKKEIRRLIGKSRQSGFSIIPLNLHLTRGKIKTTIALAKGKKRHDKRHAIQERDWKRQQERLLKRQ